MEDFRVMKMSYHDFSSGYMDAYIFQNSLNCTHTIGEFMALNYTSIRMIKSKTCTEPYHV